MSLFLNRIQGGILLEGGEKGLTAEMPHHETPKHCNCSPKDVGSLTAAFACNQPLSEALHPLGENESIINSFQTEEIPAAEAAGIGVWVLIICD